MVGSVTGTGVATWQTIDEPPLAELLRGERLRSVSIETRLLLVAARLALRDAGLTDGAVDPDELGIVVATRHAGLQDYVELFLAGLERDDGHVNPAHGPQTGLNAPATQLSIRLPAAGPNATVASGAVGGIEAVRYAGDALAAGRARAMLVCGVDVVPAVLREPDHEGDRDGAAAVVVLEASLARARGTAVGVGVAGVATAHSPDDGAADARRRAVREALHEARLSGDAVEVGFAAAPERAESAGVVERLATAATSLSRCAARVPVVVCACDELGSAGAVVLAGQDAWESS